MSEAIKIIFHLSPLAQYSCEHCTKWRKYKSNPTWGKCSMDNVPRFMHETYHTRGCNFHSLIVVERKAQEVKKRDIDLQLTLFDI